MKVLKKVGLAAVCAALIAAIITVCVLYIPVRYQADNKRFALGWATDNNGYDKNSEEVNRLISVVPTELQTKFSDLGYYSFIHYGMNTFTDVEWGTGEESPSQFTPTTVDTDQWVQALKASGSKGIIFTAKHHDGFCLWPSKYTEHDIANSPYQDGKGDIVKQLADSCKKYGVKFGIYLSPWDMHEETYGTDAYNDYFVNQLTELCTNYGELFTIWFDGARGDGIPGDFYDFDRYYEVIRKLQPNCAISNVGPDVRWIGNEAGVARKSEWSVVSKGNESAEAVAAKSQKTQAGAKDLQAVAYDAEDVGSREVVSQYKNLIFKPAEADVSIRKGWFYHADQDNTVKSVDKLVDMYYKNVGGNSFLLLNVPPSKNGVIEAPDVQALKEMGDRLQKDFSKPVEATLKVGNAEETKDNVVANSILSDGSYKLKDDEYILDFDFEGEKEITRVVLRENISYSQRVEAFDVYAKVNGKYQLIEAGTVIGSMRIVRMDQNRKNPGKAEGIRIVVRQSRSNPVLRSVQLFEKP